MIEHAFENGVELFNVKIVLGDTDMRDMRVQTTSAPPTPALDQQKIAYRSSDPTPRLTVRRGGQAGVQRFMTFAEYVTLRAQQQQQQVPHDGRNMTFAEYVTLRAQQVTP